MATNVEVRKGGTENTSSLIRRFTKRMQGSGVLRLVRSVRFHERSKSKFTAKKQRLKSIARKEHIDEQIKLGKMPERPVRRGHRR
ncbi:MAG TPA: hypothetical protein VGA06_00420 [Candidatus Paceibacterota bacterium]|jgi:ribosomal protein S21